MRREKRPRRAGDPVAARHLNRPYFTRYSTAFPDDLEALLDLWTDVSDRLLCAGWWRLTDGEGLDDLERYRLARVHFATSDQWAIAQALTAAAAFGVKPTIPAILELATVAGCTYFRCELEAIRYVESTSAGIHVYVAILLDCVRRRGALHDLGVARERLLNPTIPARLTVRGLKSRLAQNGEGLPEPPPIRLPPKPPMVVRVRRVG